MGRMRLLAAAALSATAVLAPRIASATSREFDACMARIDPAALTTTQRLACATAEMERADAALNQAYRRKMAALSPDDRNRLRDLERAWITQCRAACAENPRDDASVREFNRMACLVDRTDARTGWLPRWIP